VSSIDSSYKYDITEITKIIKSEILK